ncbi:MAG TPA: type II toxin-antitoxin system VapC family toxin [Parafilimonas sp.]
MELKCLLDSNTVIDFLGKKYPGTAAKFISDIIDEIPNLSIISKIEILSYKTSTEEYSILSNFCNDAIIINLNDEIVNKTIALRINHKIKTPDAIIAATALTNDLILITANTDDFNKIPDLTIINPWHL